MNASALARAIIDHKEPLDRLCELHGISMARVLAFRNDAQLDRLGELSAYRQAWVLEMRDKTRKELIWK